MFGKKENLLDFRFKINPEVKWHLDDNGVVVLELENTGFFNRVAQTVFKRPRVSMIDMDELGSTVWLSLEKYDDIMSISQVVHEKFGDKAEPLLPRLARFFQIMLDNELVERKQ